MPVRGLRRLAERGVDGEAVVVGGDLDPAGGQVHHRLVDAAVPVRQLVGAEAQRAAEQLVAEADAEVRDAGGQHLAQHLDRAVRGRRVAGTVGEEHPVRVRAAMSAKVAVAGSTWTSIPRSAIRYGVIDLMPRSTATTVKPLLAAGLDHVRLGGADLVGQVRAQHRRLLQHPPSRAPGSVSTLDTPTRMAPRSRRCRVSARVSTSRHADDALGGELVGQAAPGAPVRRDPGRIADDVAGDPDPARLVVLVVPAGVADVRRGRDDHLPVVAGVGERLLVARHRGGEHRLAEGLPDRTEGTAAEGPPVFENQDRLRGPATMRSRAWENQQRA